jgi:hypothetical protein
MNLRFIDTKNPKSIQNLFVPMKGQPRTPPAFKKPSVLMPQEPWKCVKHMVYEAAIPSFEC